jgi:hypothetical protein
MAVDVVFNELSLQPTVSSAHDATELFKELIRTIRKFRRDGPGGDFRAAADFHSENFFNEDGGESLTLRDCANRCDDRMLKQYSLALFNQTWTPPIENDEALCTHDDRTSDGLAACYVLDGLAVSLKSADAWDARRINVVVHEVEAESSGDFVSHQETLKHASTAEHADSHIPESEPPRDPEELWRRRREYFPSLRFCQDAKDKILDLDRGHPLFRQLYKRLSLLEDYFNAWDGGEFDADAISGHVTPQSRRAREEFEEAHAFQYPDGEEFLVSWHSRVTPEPNRIYFQPWRADHGNYGLICYIGHLPTPKYPELI